MSSCSLADAPSHQPPLSHVPPHRRAPYLRSPAATLYSRRGVPASTPPLLAVLLDKSVSERDGGGDRRGGEKERVLMWHPTLTQPPR